MKKLIFIATLLLSAIGSMSAQETGKFVFKSSDGFYTGLHNGGLVYNEVSIGCDIASAVGITVDFQSRLTNSNKSMGFSATLSAVPEAEGRFSCEPYLKMGAERAVFHQMSDKFNGFCAFGTALNYRVYNDFSCGFDASFVISKELVPVVGIKFSYKL